MINAQLAVDQDSFDEQVGKLYGWFRHLPLIWNALSLTDYKCDVYNLYNMNSFTFKNLPRDVLPTTAYCLVQAISRHFSRFYIKDVFVSYHYCQVTIIK